MTKIDQLQLAVAKRDSLRFLQQENDALGKALRAAMDQISILEHENEQLRRLRWLLSVKEC